MASTGGSSQRCPGFDCRPFHFPLFSAKIEEHIEDCERIVRVSSCLATQAEHWRLKSEVSWVRLPVTAGLFTFLYFRLITSKFLYELVYFSWYRKS